jgi:copper chaperone
VATTTTYTVSGMTCEHCVHAVTSELEQLDGVQAVDVDLVAGGDSRVTVTSGQPLAPEAVAAAVDEAGDYAVVGSADPAD